MINTAVLIDTNIILDVLEKREPFYESSNDVLLCCASKKITGYIALHSVSNIFYILRKQYSAEDRRRLILGILDFLQVATAKHENVRHALERNDFSDFEDCLQDECALENHADYIITRNTDDFKNSRIPALTPADFLQKHRP
ncbi:MAG: PIN domain-containing protein [Lachnospiraceae bacterium]|nr:PIN domain-containing protein [Lachnospiraceae bacterium]